MNKNTFIGLVLVGLIMFGFTWYQSKQYQEQAAVQAQLDSIANMERLQQIAIDSVKRAQGITAENEVKVVNMPMYKDSSLTAASVSSGNVYKIANDKVELEFTTKGAQLYSVKINDYMTYDSSALYLIKPGGSQMGIEVYVGELINTKNFDFQVAECNDTSIVMQLPFSNGGYIQQKYWLTEGSYMMQNELSFVGLDTVIPRNVHDVDINWDVTIPRLEKGYKNEKQYSKLDYYFMDEKKPEEIARGRDESEKVVSRFKWFAFHQQFFSAIMTAEKDFSSADFDVRYFNEDDPSKNLMACSANLKSEIAHDANIVLPFSFYLGPNDYTTLKSYDLKYEKSIPLGGWMVNWFSRLVIIPCFDLLGKFISNYGIVILIMTLLIKLLISPLTIKSYKSTAKMQVIKPEIDKLNEKYPDQKDAMK